LLASLPRLTKLWLWIDDPAASGCLRAGLSDLAELDLSFLISPYQPMAARPAGINGNPNGNVAHMLSNLSCCRRMQRLKLHVRVSYGNEIGMIKSAQLRTVLEQMPLLSEVRLVNVHLDSLEFLSSGTLPCTLTCLSLRQLVPRLTHEELAHIGALKSLVTLELEAVLREPLPVFARMVFTQPMLAVWLPALKKLDIDKAHVPPQ
jgi:hypothetical protein